MTAHPEAQARTLAALALRMPEPTRRDLIEEMLALVATIDPAGPFHRRVDMLGAVAPLLSSHQLPRALGAAERAGDESARASTLATITRHLPEASRSETAITGPKVALKNSR
jgi:hypothetical protein